MNVRAKSARGGLGLVAALVPWIVFWVLVGNVDIRLACLVALVIVALEVLRTILAGATPKVLEIGTFVVFVALSVVALASAVLFTKWYPERVHDEAASRATR